MSADKHIHLDQIDDLIRHFRPIEQLFRVMSAVSNAECDAETVRSCSDIGLALTANFREHLERTIWGNEDESGNGHQGPQR